MLFTARALLPVFIFVLLFQSAFAQICYTAEEEQALDFVHPKDGSDFFIAVHKDWAFASVDGVKTTYDKGTSELTIATGSIVATQSELSTRANTIFSEYNAENDYEKLVEKTETTVNGYTAFFLEFKDLQITIPDYGKAMVIFGEEAEGAKKYYLFTLRAKEANLETEKGLFDKALGTFSLLELSECVQDTLPDDSGNDANTDNGAAGDDTGTGGSVDDDTGGQIQGDDSTGASEPNDSTFDDPNPNGLATETPSDNKIFGFDPIIVFAAVAVIILLFVFFLILIAIIVALAYFGFIKKR